MNEWEMWLKEYNKMQLCSDEDYEEAVKYNDKAMLVNYNRQRNISRKAMIAVKEAYESNPLADESSIRRQAYKNATKSVILTLLLSALIYTAIGKAIDYFIKKIFSK